MRKLTHYELSILIKNEIKIMYKNSIGKFDVRHAAMRTRDILEYIEEYEQIEPMED